MGSSRQLYYGMVLQLFRRGAITVSVLLAAQIGVIRTALVMDCARPATRSVAVVPGIDSRTDAAEPVSGSGGGGMHGLPAAFSVASCQAPGSLRPDPPALARSVAVKSNPPVDLDRRARSDWNVPPPFHPPRRS